MFMAGRMQRRARLRDVINEGMPEVDRAVKDYKLDEYYDQALSLIASGRARDAFAIEQEAREMRDRYGRNTFGQSLLLARRLVEAGTRVVEVVWPKVANSNNHSWDVHNGLTKRIGTQSGPMFDRGISGLIAPILMTEVCWKKHSWSPLENSVAARSAASPPPATETAMMAATTGHTATRPWSHGAGMKRGYVHGKSDQTASAPLENPVHPGELLATIYESVGIAPDTIVYNHLKPTKRTR